MRKGFVILFFLSLTINQCEVEPEFPDEPEINYESFALYITTNSLEQEVLTGNVKFSFTDGDGNVGFTPYPDSLASELPDSIRYNMFFQLYDFQNYDFIKIPEDEGGLLKYVIPYLDKRPLSGTVSVTIEYPIISYDTIFYTFYIYDREYNRSNTDTTEVRILSGILD